jgi:pyruvate formate lyase activating enzyme
MTHIRADAPFYQASGGGITLSGGEPLQQAAFSLALLQACQSAGFHTAVQTCAETEWCNLEAVLPYVDLFIIDIKVLDEQTHVRVTGKSNRRILENIRQLAALDKTIQFRIPVVPTVNDTADALTAIRRFVRQLPGRQREPELVPFHNMAAAKYQSLGRIYKASGLQNISKEQLARLQSVEQQHIFDFKMAGRT